MQRATFINIGQILPTRTDIVSEEFTEEFEKLQDHVKTDDYSAVSAIVQAEAGHPVEDLFEKFEQKPLASASIAQVHTDIPKTKVNGQAEAKMENQGVPPQESAVKLAFLGDLVI